MDGARAALAFRNLERLRGVDGLDEMVAFLRNNRNNANGIDGAIYESTVARKILDGQVPSSGTLQRVSNDGLANANRVDTTTNSLAIQIKHMQDSNGVFTPSGICGSGGVCGDAYLAQLQSQASVLGKQPALITNRAINQDLQQLLTQRGIQWIQVSD